MNAGAWQRHRRPIHAGGRMRQRPLWSVGGTRTSRTIEGLGSGGKSRIPPAGVRFIAEQALQLRLFAFSGHLDEAPRHF